MTSEPKLEILLLGTPAVYYGGKPIQIQRRLLRAILFFLAYTRRLVSRAGLIMTVWPEESEEDGRRHLRESLSKLRRELPVEDILVTDQDRVSLDFNQVRVDVHEFVAIMTRTKLALQQATSPILSPSTLQDVLYAVKLWRGPTYMTGFNTPESEEYEIWMADTRRELGNDKQYLVKKIVAHYMAANDHIEALRWLRNALLADEFDLELQMQKLIALERLGQINEALEYYDQVSKVFENEGMGELPENFTNFHQKLLKRKKGSSTEANVIWSSPLDLHVPFAGRKNLLNSLKASFHNGETAVIFGEAGAGKTRLLFELFTSLSPSPPLLFTSGKMMESVIPFQPFIDLFRQKMTAEDWEKIDPRWLPYLSTLLPEIQTKKTHASQTNTVVRGQDRSMAFEAIHQVLLHLSRMERVFLCLDDAQWCDPDTLASLSYLQTRGFFERHGFLALSCRERDATTALDEFLKSRIRSTNTKVIILPGLDKDDLHIISQAILGNTPSDAFIENLLAETGGNPLFVLETLHVVQQQSVDKINLDNLGILPIPSTVHDLILSRFNALSDNAHQLLVTAAVLSGEINTNLIASASQLGLEKTVAALEELEQSHLIRSAENNTEGVDYRFIHGQVRQVITKELNPARLKLIHSNVAVVLEEQFGNDHRHAAKIADHFLQAGEIVKAFHYRLTAGIYSDKMLSPLEALSNYEKAEILLSYHENLIPDEYIYNLYTSIIRNYYASSNIELVKVNAQKLLRHGRARGSALLIGSALSSLGYVESLVQNPVKGIEYLVEATPYIEKTTSQVEKAELFNRLALMCQLGLQFSKAEEYFKKAINLCGDAPEPELVQVRINTNLNLALLYFLLAEPRKEERFADLVIKDCEQVGDTQTIGKAYSFKAYCNLMYENFDEATQFTRASQHILKTQNNIQFSGYLTLTQAQIFQNMGNLDDAYEQYQEVFHLIRPGEFNDVLAEAHVNYGNFFLYLFAPDKAKKIFEFGLNLQGDLVQKYTLAVGMAHALAGLGQVDAAEKMLAPVLRDTEKYSLMLAHLHAKICSGVLATYKGDFSLAWDELEWSRKETDKRGFKTLWAAVDFFAGNLLLAQKKPEEALEYAMKFERNLARMQNPWLEVSSLRLKSKALRMMGDSDAGLKKQVLVPLEQLRKGCKFAELIPYYQNYQKIVLADF